MKKAPIPADEQQRLSALRSLGILDTPAEERFDRLTRLAQRMFGTPIALFSLVDADRQWFKSRQGLDASETPRNISFCGHAILDEQPLVIRDTHDDERFADNPLVTGDPRIRFYAGYPISVPEGGRVGTLCIIDSHPRDFSAEDLEVLRDLGQTLEDELGAYRLAAMDELTQLANRRGLQRIGSAALALCRRADMSATLLYFDVDGLKKINDTFGHEAGDAAIRDFASLLWDAFRESDVVARVGGDEFCALLTATDAAGCRVPLDRMAANTAALNAEAGRDYQVAYSFGVVEFDPKQHESVEDLLKAADERMYAMKQEQRRS